MQDSDSGETVEASPAAPQLRSHLSAASIASSTESSGDSGDKSKSAAAAASTAAAAADCDEIPISRGIVSGPEAGRSAPAATGAIPKSISFDKTVNDGKGGAAAGAGGFGLARSSACAGAPSN